MAQTDDLENLLNQLNELYQFILDNQNKNLIVPPETLEAIHGLSKLVEDMGEHTDREIMRMGMNPEMIKNTILESKTQLPLDLKNVLEKSQQLKSQLEGCRNVLKDSINKHKEEKRKKSKRKDKFKNIGSKEGWIPM